MNQKKWLEENTSSLAGKTVALTGSTGGLGKELCRYLAYLGASLILVDRNPERSRKHRDEINEAYPDTEVKCITADLENMDSVRSAAVQLLSEPVDIFIHNAGAYAIERHTCDDGLDNVFQINFVSPYYMIKTLLPLLRQRGGRVVIVGSIAHNYSKADPKDIDFSGRKRASLVYGNAKRYLMFSLVRLFRNETAASLSITHPGITFTNITAHYPKVVFAVIKYPMKVIFMKPSKACLSILRGIFEPCHGSEWIGPAIFGIWGAPKKSALSTCKDNESEFIFRCAEDIYRRLTEKAE